MAQPFTTRELRVLREIHAQRLHTSRRVNTRTGEAIGAPGKLQSLGAFLATHGAVGFQTDAEQWFGLDASYYKGLAESGCILLEGERFAATIMDEIRSGGDGLLVRPPSDRTMRRAMAVAA